jgi:acetyl esterase/lipase
MALDPRAKRFLDLLAAGGAAEADGAAIAQRRAGLVELMTFGGPSPPVAAVQDREVPGGAGPIGARIYAGFGSDESAPAAAPGIVYFHGGGLVAGSVQTHDAFARGLANAGRCKVVSIDYRLAPEHPFPAAFEDAVAAAAHVSAHADEFGIDPARLGICGDSAGGSLAAAACHALTAAGDARIAAGAGTFALQLLICPILDYSAASASRREFARGYLVGEATLRDDLRHYLSGGGDAADPRVSPLRARYLGGVPPTSVHTAQYDPLRDEGQAYAERLTAQGTDATHTCHPGMIHLFYGLASVIPYAHTAIAQIGSDIRARLAPYNGVGPTGQPRTSE